MSWRTILVPMVGEPGDKLALDGATRIARDFGARVKAVLIMRNPKEALAAVGEGMSAPMIEQIYDAAEQSAAATEKVAREVFTAWKDETGIDADFSVELGSFDDVAPKMGRAADLICTRRPTDDDADEVEDIVVSSALASGRPVLMAAGVTDIGEGSVAAICWNGSTEAARAIAMAAPLLAKASEVKVLCGTSGGGGNDADELVANMKAGGANVSLHSFNLAAGVTGVDLCMEANKAGADYMVIGAYSHSRLREYVFGGVTEDILHAAGLPVVMAG